MVKQRTLKNTIKAIGVGVHSNKTAYLTFKPALADTGIVFRRVDVTPHIDILACVENVSATTLCTSLSSGGCTVSTVEHVLSAMAGLGIDNAIVEITAQELPIMDGSSGPFVFLLKAAGLKELDAPKKMLLIKEKIIVQEEDKWASLEPYSGYKISCGIDFQHPTLTDTMKQATFNFSSTAYINEVSRARTFGFLKDVEYLRKNNLGLGGSLENAVVLDDETVMNEDGLRYSNELVRHKILDAIGDLYLLGMGVIGEFSGFKSGHHLNNLLLQKLLANKDAWEIISCVADEMPIAYAEASAA
ncbi:MAG: UDP-3-O-[3-hydroxymyristoyl] N-acetylglucosamine deacetylase [Legionellales bacterium]|nr:MAG: UDP-3-O-[3-hydroxymyristoyl] N-acetylglucosamine deacetylase [Legionellales bacterium]